MNPHNFHYKKINQAVIAALGTVLLSPTVYADCTVVTGNKLKTDNTLYFCQNVGAYDEIEIKTTTAGAIAPLSGYGIYNQSGVLKQVYIETSGDSADGIMQRVSTNLIIGDNLEIITKGSSADGINLTITGASQLTIGNNAKITTSNGSGIRSNLSNQSTLGNRLDVGDNLTVKTFGAGNNYSQASNYGVYAGARDRETENIPVANSAKIVIGNNSVIETSGNKAYAVFANKTGTVELGSTTITTTGNQAHALVAKDGSVEAGVNFCGILGRPACVTRTFDGGQIYLTGDTTISVDQSKSSYAMYSSGKDSLIISQANTGVSTPAVYNVTGNLVAENQGGIKLSSNGTSVFNSDVNVKNTSSLIDLNLMGKTQFSGNFDATDSGSIVLTMKDSVYVQGDATANTPSRLKAVDSGSITANLSGNSVLYAASDAGYISGAVTPGTININVDGSSAKWKMNSNSEVTNLNLINGGEVILGDNNAPDSSNRVDLVVRNLSGSGVFYVRSDLARDGNTTVNNGDMIHITDSSSGTHKVYVRDANLGNVAISTLGTEVLRIVEDSSGGSATFTLGGKADTGVEQTSVDVGAYSYILDKEENITRAGVTYWDLFAKPSNAGGAGGSTVGGSGGGVSQLPDLNNNAQNTVNLLNANYVLGYIENQTLLQRMGELRQSDGQGGDVWGRAYGGKADHFDGRRLSGFDMSYMGMQIGADRKLEIGQNDADLYLGAMAGTTKADVSYRVGSGDVDGYHAGLYGTYVNPNGFYVDGLIKYVHMKNKINTLTGGGIPVNGSGNTKGFAVGIEVGKRFYLQQPNEGWYIEPQAQLTYSHQGGATINSSTGLKTELGSYNSTLGRGSVIIGYSVVKGDNPINVYVKTGYVREFSGKTHYTFNYFDRERYDFSGGWWDNGIGVNMQINKKHNLYLDATYAKGGRFDHKQLNLGYRYSF